MDIPKSESPEPYGVTITILIYLKPISMGLLREACSAFNS